VKSDNEGTLVFLGCLGAIALVAILVAVSALFVSIVWGLIVPVIFPAAVAQSLLPASLTIFQAFKLSVLFWALGITGSSAVITADIDLNGCGGAIVKYLISILVWVVLVAISGVLVFLVWGWVVPDIMSGAVALGVIPATLTFWHSVLLAVLFSFLGLSTHVTSKSSKK